MWAQRELKNLLARNTYDSHWTKSTIKNDDRTIFVYIRENALNHLSQFTWKNAKHPTYWKVLEAFNGHFRKVAGVVFSKNVIMKRSNDLEVLQQYMPMIWQISESNDFMHGDTSLNTSHLKASNLKWCGVTNISFNINAVKSKKSLQILMEETTSIKCKHPCQELKLMPDWRNVLKTITSYKNQYKYLIFVVCLVFCFVLFFFVFCCFRWNWWWFAYPYHQK